MKIGFVNANEIFGKVKDLDFNFAITTSTEEDYHWHGENVIEFKTANEFHDFVKALVFFDDQCRRLKEEKEKEEADKYPELIGPSENLPEDNSPKRIVVKQLINPLTTATDIGDAVIEIQLSYIRDGLELSLEGSFAEYLVISGKESTMDTLKYKVGKELVPGNYILAVVLRDSEEGYLIERESIDIVVEE